MYIMDNFTNSIYQYSLSTPGDLSTTVYDSILFSYASETTNAVGFEFNNDFTQLFISDATTIYKYLFY